MCVSTGALTLLFSGKMSSCFVHLIFCFSLPVWSMEKEYFKMLSSHNCKRYITVKQTKIHWSLKCLENGVSCSIHQKALCHLVQMFVFTISACCHHCWPQKRVWNCLLTSHLISASILGPVFGNQDQFLGLAIFLDTFRNDLHGMDVSVLYVCVCVWHEAIDRFVSLQGLCFPTMLSSTGWPCL